MKEKKFLKIMFMAVVLYCTIVLSGKNVSAENGATGISVNTPVYGSIEECNDSKWYSFSSSTRGYFYVSFKLTDVKSEATYSIKIYDADRKQLYFDCTESSSESFYISNAIGSTYYIELIKENLSIGEYELKVNFTADLNWESEYNDTEASANLLTPNQTVTGTINNAGMYGYDEDVDVFKISLKKDSIVNIDFGSSNVSNARNFDLNLYNSKGVKKLLANYSNESEHFSYYLAKGNYYIKVSTSNVSSYTPYVIKYTTKKISSVKSPTIKNATIKKYSLWGTYLSQVKLSKNVKNVDTYEVKVSGQKNMKKPVLTTTADASKNINNFVSNTVGSKKAYYVQLRPCKIDAFGKKIYTGKKSNVVKAKIVD
ncbi:MAG: PPC domain-containing protein [Lachnospiraceae bacterium]|nr:PPC domain-containing protein [Lachnospiraceae bacterium]